MHLQGPMNQFQFCINQEEEEIGTSPGCWKALSQSLVTLHWFLPVLVLVNRRLKYYFIKLEKLK